MGEWASAEYQTAMAAHFSLDGRHLALLNQRERVIFVQNWERILRGEATLEQCTLVVRSNDALNYYLAVAHDRFAVAAVCRVITRMWSYTENS